MIFTIDKNPENETFDELLDLAFEICTEFHLVLRRDMGNIRALDPILDQLKESFKEMRLESKWASTILEDDNKAEVYYYHADEKAKRVVRGLSNSLYEWSLSEPNVLPEDLSFFKGDNIWLVNCAHERESYINTDDEEVIKRLKNIKGLKISEYSF